MPDKTFVSLSAFYRPNETNFQPSGIDLSLPWGREMVRVRIPSPTMTLLL